MKCMVCKNGTTEPGETTITLTKNDTTAVFKKVPADVCNNCGEAYVSDEVTNKLLTEANQIADNGVQVDVRNFKAA